MNVEGFKKITKKPLFLPLICLAVVLIFGIIFVDGFLSISLTEVSGSNVLNGRLIDILNRSSELVIFAVGMTLCVASSAGTDISVGAVSAVAGALCCYALGEGTTYAVPYAVGLLLAALMGIVCGCWNGFLVAYLKIQPMVATLILFTAGRGIAQLIVDGKCLYVKVPEFQYLGNFIPGCPIPTPIFVAIVVVVLTLCILKFTALGLYIQTVGINAKAARLVGLNSNFIIFLTYAFCGICAGIAGMVITSRVHSIDANNAGLNKELDAILSVALGGNSLGGGRFSLMGSVIGAITLQTLTTVLLALKVPAVQLPIYKAIIVVVIVSLQSPELKRMWNHFKQNFGSKSEGKKVA